VKNLLASTSLLLVVAACGSTPTQQTTDLAPIGATTAGPLYARDGSVVAVPPKSSSRVEPETKRDLGDREGSRPYLLELYQKAVEEKNALSVEVENFKAALEQERKLNSQGAEERALLRAEITKLSQERDNARNESVDLASRLTTAQIARLEAEKALLEVQIANRQREDAAVNARAASSAPAKEPKKRPGGDHP